jgi:hypothetical protein
LFDIFDKKNLEWLYNPSMTLDFKYKLLPKTEAF